MQQAIVEAKPALFQCLSDFLAHGQPNRIEDSKQPMYDEPS